MGRLDELSGGRLAIKLLSCRTDPWDVRSSPHTVWICAWSRRIARRRAMTLVELMLAMTIAVGIMVSLGHVITQMTSGVARLENKTRLQSEVSLAMLRMRSELQYASSITSLSETEMTFVRGDITGDGEDDQITYRWSGQAGEPIYRLLNDGEAEPILESCESFQIESTIGLIKLETGQWYDLKMEYFEDTGNAVAELYWSSETQAKQIVPSGYLRTVPAGGIGLSVEIYDNSDLTDLKVIGTDPYIDFNWWTGSPHPAIGPDTFSIRWTGQVRARYSEIYTFHTRSDDGVRLWVNDQLIIDNWTANGLTEDSGKTSSPVDLIDLHIEAGPPGERVYRSSSVHCMNRPEVRG